MIIDILSLFLSIFDGPEDKTSSAEETDKTDQEKSQKSDGDDGTRGLEISKDPDESDDEG